MCKSKTFDVKEMFMILLDIKFDSSFGICVNLLVESRTGKSAGFSTLVQSFQLLR